MSEILHISKSNSYNFVRKVQLVQKGTKHP